MTLPALAAVLVVAVLIALLKGGARMAGALLLGLGLVTISWNAVRIGPFEPGDLLLLLAALLLALHALARRQAPWMPLLMLGGAALITASGLLTALAPPSVSYLSGRVTFPDPYVLYGLHAANTGGNMTELAKFLVALVLLPVVVQLLHPSRREVRWLAGAWAASALISAAVAITDASGLTHISVGLLGYLPANGRQAGLSVQPNHLAVALILVTPVVLSWLRSRRRLAVLAALAALVVLSTGVLLTASRGGFVGLILAAALTIIAVPELRPSPRTLAVTLPVLGLVLLAVGASLLPDLATQTRLAGGLGDLSDAQRAALQAQAIADFTLSPIHGIGYDHVVEAHLVFLQLLAAGGIIGLAGYALYWFGVVRTAVLARRFEPGTASVLLVSSLCFLAVNLVENQVTDRYLYVPAALAVALLAAGRRAVAADGTAVAQPRAGAAALPQARAAARRSWPSPARPQLGGTTTR